MSLRSLPLTLFAAAALLGAAPAEVYILDFSKTPAAGRLSINEIPAPPASRVVDEAGALPAELRSDIEAKLGASQSAPTYLVIVSGELPAPPEVYGNELLRRWVRGGGRLGALILTVSEPVPATHLMIAGRTLDRTDVEQLHQLGTAALSLATEDGPQAESAARSAIGLLPALETFAEVYQESISSPDPDPVIAATTGVEADAPSAPSASEEYVPKTISHWDTLSAKLDWEMIRITSAVIGGIVLLAVLALLLPRLLRHRRLTFPECEPRQRFNAPFSGGSNAQIKFRA